MTYEELITEVARRLEWTDEKTSGIVGTIFEVVGAELKMNNPVALDDFGTLKTGIQPEYILVDPVTKECCLMPPAVEVVFETPSPEEEGGNPMPSAAFTPDDAFYNELNNSFSQFEPTPLDEGMQLPGVPEIIAVEQEQEQEPETGDETPEPEAEPIPAELPPTPGEPVPLPGDIPPPLPQAGATGLPSQPVKDVVPAGVAAPETSPETSPGQYPPRDRSRRPLGNNKRRPSVWIPIAGGIAIIVASLFFFKGDGDR